MSLVIEDRKDNSKEKFTAETIADRPIQWTTTLASIIPEDFVVPDEYATAHITVEDALSHRTGMPCHLRHFGPKGSKRTVKDEVRQLRYLPLTAELRARYMYNNLMYTAVSHAIEKLTEKPLGEFLRDRIWKPLKMDNTYWTSLDEHANHNTLGLGYAWDATKNLYVPEPLPDVASASGAGAIISSVLDYASWIRCMIFKAGPLSLESHRALTQPRSIIIDDEQNLFREPHFYSLGWTLDSYRGEQIIWHNGGETGYGTTMMYFPSHQRGLVMAGNTSFTSNIVQTILYMHLLDHWLSTPEADQVDWNSLIKGKIYEHRKKQADAKERLYPDLPGFSIPPALRLREYTGNYYHAAYGELLFHVDRDSKRLVADRLSYQISMVISMEHVNGEFWLATLMEQNKDPRDHEKVRAEFRIGFNSRVKEIGLDMEAEMGGELIWFRKGIV